MGLDQRNGLILFKHNKFPVIVVWRGEPNPIFFLYSWYYNGIQRPQLTRATAHSGNLSLLRRTSRWRSARALIFHINEILQREGAKAHREGNYLTSYELLSLASQRNWHFSMVIYLNFRPMLKPSICASPLTGKESLLDWHRPGA